jgi:hypothetical protein
VGKTPLPLWPGFAAFIAVMLTAHQLDDRKERGGLQIETYLLAGSLLTMWHEGPTMACKRARQRGPTALQYCSVGGYFSSLYAGPRFQNTMSSCGEA